MIAAPTVWPLPGARRRKHLRIASGLLGLELELVTLYRRVEAGMIAPAVVELRFVGGGRLRRPEAHVFSPVRLIAAVATATGHVPIYEREQHLDLVRALYAAAEVVDDDDVAEAIGAAA